MGSSFNRKQSLILIFVTTIIGVLTLFDIIQTTIPFFVCILLAFIMGNVIVPIIDSKKAKKEYNDSIGNTSLTCLTINRNVPEQIDISNIVAVSEGKPRKFYPRQLIYMIAIINIFAILATVFILVSWFISQVEIEHELIVLLSIVGIVLVLLDLGFAYLTKSNIVIVSDTRLKTYMWQNFDLSKKGKIETILYSNINEVNIKKNKYINYKNKGVIFEFSLNDGSKRIFLSNVLSDKQRTEIAHILQDKIK
ncbi:hypothetical protein RJI07_04675 [Mycoplasmatota bacterium WC30]